MYIYNYMVGWEMMWGNTTQMPLDRVRHCQKENKRCGLRIPSLELRAMPHLQDREPESQNRTKSEGKRDGNKVKGKEMDNPLEET